MVVGVWSEGRGYCVCFFFQAEDGIRDLVRSRGLGDVYKRQAQRQSVRCELTCLWQHAAHAEQRRAPDGGAGVGACLLYTSDAADDLLCVDLGGRRNIKKKNRIHDLQILTPAHRAARTLHATEAHTPCANSCT